MPGSAKTPRGGRPPSTPKQATDIKQLRAKINQLEQQVSSMKKTQPKPKSKVRGQTKSQQPRSRQTVVNNVQQVVRAKTGGKTKVMTTKHVHPGNSMLLYRMMTAPDKHLVDSSIVPPVRYPDGRNSTCVGFISAVQAITIPKGGYAAIVINPSGPYVNYTESSSGTPPTTVKSPSITTQSTMFAFWTDTLPTDGTEMVINSLIPIDVTATPKHWIPVAPQLGNVLWDAVVGAWQTTPTGVAPDPETTNRKYRILCGDTRVEYAPNYLSKVSSEAFQVRTGSQGGFPRFGEVLKLSEVRSNATANLKIIANTSQPGYNLRYYGAVNDNPLMTPIPFNNTFATGADLVSMIRSLQLQVRNPKLKQDVLGDDLSSSTEYHRTDDDCAYVPLQIVYNEDAENELIISVTCNYLYEFVPERGDGLPTAIADADPYISELISESRKMPWFAERHSFLDTIFNGVTSAVSDVAHGLASGVTHGLLT